MRQRLFGLFVLVLACGAGIFCGQLASRSTSFRDALGIIFGRGHLLGLAGGIGIYEVDFVRISREIEEANTVTQDRHLAPDQQRLVLERLIATTMADSLSANERISEHKLDREFDLLRSQFADDKPWRTALARSGLSARTLRRSLANNLRARQWILQQMHSLTPTPAECQAFYDAHRQSFVQPERFRASHLFLAAPPETPPEVVDLKQKSISSFSERLRNGEDFFELVAQNSEDEATKARGGDLGFFSESRMPPDFFAAVRKMHVGEISSPVRTRLGFHVIQVTDSKSPRPMTFDEARPEISLGLENAKGDAAVRNVSGQLFGRVALLRALP